MITPGHDRHEFMASPVGRCLIGPTFVVWCAAPELQGSIVWGELDDHTIRDLVAIAAFVHHPALAVPRRVLTDLRAVTRADADVLLAFAATAGSHVTGIERRAVIVPPGLAGMMMSGALSIVGAEHATRVAHDVSTALAFLDHPLGASAHAAATAIAAAMRGRSAVVGRLHETLAADLKGATIEGCARALGMSSRTLQRELRARSTSFSGELRRARLATAEALLVHTDRKVEAIAADVGFGTASRLSERLRHASARTAMALRAERRG